MKKNRLIILSIAITTFSSCQFNQSVNKDLTTGAYSKGNGIVSDNVVIEINGKAENRNEFVFGEKVKFIFNDINGLTSSNGKTYPGLSMYIVKNEKDTILSNPNLLKSLNDGTDLSPLQLQAGFRTLFPNQNNEKYKAHVEIWDKKGDGKLNYELPFTIKENNLLNISSNGIEYSNIYLWNSTLNQPIIDNNINSEHSFIMIFNGVEGFKLKNNNVFPILSIELIDNIGNKIFSNPNLLSEYENGISPIDFKGRLTTPEFAFRKGKINNPLKLNVNFKDKNSSKDKIC